MFTGHGLNDVFLHSHMSKSISPLVLAVDVTMATATVILVAPVFLGQIHSQLANQINQPTD